MQAGEAKKREKRKEMEKSGDADRTEKARINENRLDNDNAPIKLLDKAPTFYSVINA